MAENWGLGVEEADMIQVIEEKQGNRKYKSHRPKFLAYLCDTMEIRRYKNKERLVEQPQRGDEGIGSRW